MRQGLHQPEPWLTGGTGRPRPARQQFDLMASDAQAAPEHELRVHAAVAASTPGLSADAADRLDQPGVADLPGTERPVERGVDTSSTRQATSTGTASAAKVVTAA